MASFAPRARTGYRVSTTEDAGGLTLAIDRAPWARNLPLVAAMVCLALGGAVLGVIGRWAFASPIALPAVAAPAAAGVLGLIAHWQQVHSPQTRFPVLAAAVILGVSGAMDLALAPFTWPNPSSVYFAGVGLALVAVAASLAALNVELGRVWRIEVTTAHVRAHSNLGAVEVALADLDEVVVEHGALRLVLSDGTSERFAMALAADAMADLAARIVHARDRDRAIPDPQRTPPPALSRLVAAVRDA